MHFFSEMLVIGDGQLRCVCNIDNINWVPAKLQMHISTTFLVKYTFHMSPHTVILEK